MGRSPGSTHKRQGKSFPTSRPRRSTMRVLSPHAGYGIQLFGTGERVIPDASGYAVSVPVRKQIHAQFTNSGLLDHEADIALSAFDFSALSEGVNPLTRVGVFDTEAYCISSYEDEKERKAMQAQ